VLEQLVAAGFEHEAVEAEVGLHEGVQVVSGGGHRLVQLVERRDLLVGGPLRRQAGGGGLDHPAQLERLLEEARIRAGLDLPGEDVRVEEVPVAPRTHAGADLRPRLHEPLGGEDLDRLAYHGSTHLALADEPVVRKRLSGLQPAVDDPHPDLVHDLTMQPAPGVGSPFSHTIIL
jgi:hypothetical protein